MKITERLIEKAKKLDVCPEGIEWAESLLGREITIDNVVSTYYLWAVGKLKIQHDEKLLDYCAAQCPWPALLYCPDKLDAERLDYCAVCYPRAALKCCPELLTKERLDWCKERTNFPREKDQGEQNEQ